MISTIRKKTFLIFSCLVEIVFFCSKFFASGNHYQNMKTIFKRKTSLLLVETGFLVSEKQFFPFLRYSWLWKQFVRQAETYFLTNSSFWLVKKDFLSSGKSIFLFGILLKLSKLRGISSCLWKLIYWFFG